MEKLVIDTETTGLSPRFNQILTVGMLHINVEKNFLEILNSKHIFIKHIGGPINPFAMRINKINLESHNKIGISQNLACKRMNQFVNKNNLHETNLIGHNLRFDNNFLSSLFDQEEITPKFHHEHEDTMRIWRELQNCGKAPIGKRNLRTVSGHFGIDYSKAHDALADCEITAKVYHQMMKVI